MISGQMKAVLVKRRLLFNVSSGYVSTLGNHLLLGNPYSKENAKPIETPHVNAD